MISDEVLAMFELSNDLLIGKVSKERYPYYVRESLNLGREAARRVKEEWAEAGKTAETVDIFQLYEEAGIEIVYEEKSGEKYGVSFRAQSEYGKDGIASVMIYRQSIADLARHSQEMKQKLAGHSQELKQKLVGHGQEMKQKLVGHGQELKQAGQRQEIELTEENALQIHLAHEYFHYLEYHSSEILDEKTRKVYDHGFVSDYLEQVELTRIFGRKRTGGILRCSEIAAHAFAKELTGTVVLPNYFDYAYLMAEGRLLEADFLSQAQRFETYFE